MTAPQTATTLSIHPRVRFRRVLDEAVVIHQERAEALVLNETAARFLELCNGESNFEAIVEQMTAEYDTDAATLEEDITAFARELLQEGIIEPA